MASSLSHLVHHLVFSTKDRKNLITQELQRRLYDYIIATANNHGGDILEIGGIEDHIHILIKIKPARCVADIIQLIKANSSKWINEQSILRDRFAWQSGYGAFSVSASNIPAIRSYIQRQEEHHRTQSFINEFLEFLTKNGIVFDQRFLWN